MHKHFSEKLQKEYSMLLSTSHIAISHNVCLEICQWLQLCFSPNPKRFVASSYKQCVKQGSHVTAVFDDTGLDKHCQQ